MNKKTDPDYWFNRIRNSVCKDQACLGYKQNEDGSGYKCQCRLLSYGYARMHDSEYGISEGHMKIDFGSLHVDTNSKAKIEGYIKYVLDRKKFKGKSFKLHKNVLISGGVGSGKSSVVAVLVRELVRRNKDFAVCKFPKLVSLARMFQSNPVAFNERENEVSFLKDVEFLFVENVDDRGHEGSDMKEFLNYTFLDEFFAYRSKHPKRATIVSKDKNLNITPRTLGKTFYNDIFKTTVAEDELISIDLESMGE